MDEQEPVRINLQLPASALDSLSRLAEQLRLLTAAIGGHSGSPPQQAQEYGENTFFDPAQFQELRLSADAPESRRTSLPRETAAFMLQQAAVPVRSSVTEVLQTPESAGCGASEFGKEPIQKGPPSYEDVAAIEVAGAYISSRDAAPVARKEAAAELDGIPAVRPAINEITVSPTGGREPEGRTPEPERVKAEAAAWDALPSPVRTEERAGTASPLGAGVVITAEPEEPQSRWTGITEELVTSGPAPLTAEAVSLAFQRDGRRYDNGFPLY